MFTLAGMRQFHNWTHACLDRTARPPRDDPRRRLRERTSQLRLPQPPHPGHSHLQLRSLLGPHPPKSPFRRRRPSRLPHRRRGPQPPARSRPPNPELPLTPQRATPQRQHANAFSRRRHRRPHPGAHPPPRPHPRLPSQRPDRRHVPRPRLSGAGHGSQ